MGTVTQIDGFEPTPRQKQIKAKFIVKVRKSKAYNDTWTRAAIEQLLGQSLSAHWSTEFRNWLLDDTEFEAACELAAWEALDAARAIVADPAEKGQARVTAAKLIMTIADKEPKKVAERYVDGDIQKLAQDPAKLRAFLKESISKVFDKQELLELAGNDNG